MAPDPCEDPDVSPMPVAAMTAALRARGYSVFEPRTDVSIYVLCSMQLVVQMAEQGDSPPVIVAGVQPADLPGAYELLLRRPSRMELQAAMARFTASDGPSWMKHGRRG